MRILFFISIILLCSCETAVSEHHFIFKSVDSAASNIDFNNQLTFTEEYNPYTFKNFLNGGGVALGDINNDGLVDIYLSGNLVENKLYLNKGNLEFEDISQAAQVECKDVWSTGVSFVDINHDGHLDIYVCKSGDPNSPNRFNQFFINDGNLGFTDMSKEFGLDFTGLSIHSAFFDYDKDGDLDCYLLNNSIRSVGAYDIIEDQRLRPDSEGGNKLLKNLEVETGEIKFVDVSQEAGIYTSAIGFGLGVSISDLNEDGWDDIFVSNDFFEKDYLYINNQDGTFKESSEAVFSELSTGSMGADIADLNNDGKPEIFVTEMLPEQLERYKSKTVFDSYDKVKLNESKGYHRQYGRNVLQYHAGVQNNLPQYKELGRYHGVEATDWSWGALMADFDNDGLKDIFVANGIFKDLLDQDHVNFYSPQQITKMLKDKQEDVILTMMNAFPSDPVSNYFFHQNEENKFVKSHPPNSKGFSNGSAYADLDNDGDLDLVINNINAPATVYKNTTIHNHFLKVKLQGSEKNINAIGAKLKLYHQQGMRMIENHPMRGYQSCVSHDLIIGLGMHTIIDSLHIIWPNQQQSSYHNLSADSTYLFHIKEAKNIQTNSISKKEQALLKKVEGIIDYKHNQIAFADFDRNRMIPMKLSNAGPHGELGDMDNDGDIDLIIAGYAKNGVQYFENTGKQLIKKSLTEDKSKIFADKVQIKDINNDGSKDVILINGGFQYSKKSKTLEDIILINQNNKFTPNTLRAQMSSVGICQLDIDDHGAEAMVAFPSMKVGAYGELADGMIFRKDKKGYTYNKAMSIPLREMGMFKDLEFNDGDKKEIILAPSFGPLKFYTPTKDEKVISSISYPSIAHTAGMWQDIQLVDIDNNGTQDIIACNVGLNNRLYNMTKGEMYVFVADFDKNGRTDIIYCMQKEGKHYPIHLKDELLMQMPKLKKKSLKYADYAQISMEELFGDKTGEINAQIYTVNEWRSGIFMQQADNSYEFRPLPEEVQYSEMKTVCPIDLNNDGYMDLVIGGNQYEAKPEYGINAASFGCVLINDTKGSFKYLSFEDSGFFEKGQIRDILALNLKGEKYLLVLKNNDKASTYKIN